MKYLILTYGTEGDTRPLSALGRGLMDAGHDVHLLADGATLGAAAALGVPATPIAGDIRNTLQPSGSAKKSDYNTMARELAQLSNENAEHWLRATVQAGRDCDALLISGLAGFVGLSAAEYLGVKAIGAGMFPLTPTAEFASPLLPPGKLPRFLNKFSYHLINGLVWRAFRKATNAARAKVCSLPPRSAIWTDHPILYGVSPSLLPRPADWPNNISVCGQWLAPAKQWTPPDALNDFLAAGDAPIYIGFGSMAGFDTKQLFAAIVGGLAGRRALFYPGWSGLDPSQLPANIFVVGDTPHDALFPRVSMAVHHGGSGTTHSAARAGIPSVVVPFAGDQFFWADRLSRAGVGAKLSGWKALNADSLATSLRFADQAEVRANAHAMGEHMRAENGIKNAVATLEAMTG